MKSHVWNLWDRKFVVDGTATPTGRGLAVGEMEYTVHLQKDGTWVPVREDVAVGVLLSFLRRFDPKGKERLLEAHVPRVVRDGMVGMAHQFGRAREAEADSYAICALCAQEAGLVEAGSLKEA